MLQPRQLTAAKIDRRRRFPLRGFCFLSKSAYEDLVDLTNRRSLW